MQKYHKSKGKKKSPKSRKDILWYVVKCILYVKKWSLLLICIDVGMYLFDSVRIKQWMTWHIKAIQYDNKVFLHFITNKDFTDLLEVVKNID